MTENLQAIDLYVSSSNGCQTHPHEEPNNFSSLNLRLSFLIGVLVKQMLSAIVIAKRKH